MAVDWAIAGKATLGHGDAREVSLCDSGLPYCIITDPVWPNAPEGLFPGVDDPAELLMDVLSKHRDAKRIVVILRFDSDPRFLRAVPDDFPFFRLSTLEYAVPGYLGRKLGGIEVAYQFGEPIKSGPGQRVIPGIGPRVSKPNKKNGHPCPRHIDHMRWLIRWCSEPGEVVFDPFMGSGTTGVAAVESVRVFWGLELQKDYFEVALDRITEAQRRQRLPVEARD